MYQDQVTPTESWQAAVQTRLHSTTTTTPAKPLTLSPKSLTYDSRAGKSRMPRHLHLCPSCAAWPSRMVHGLHGNRLQPFSSTNGQAGRTFSCTGEAGIPRNIPELLTSKPSLVPRINSINLALDAWSCTNDSWWRQLALVVLVHVHIFPVPFCLGWKVCMESSYSMTCARVLLRITYW